MFSVLDTRYSALLPEGVYLSETVTPAFGNDQQLFSIYIFYKMSRESLLKYFMGGKLLGKVWKASGGGGGGVTCYVGLHRGVPFSCVSFYFEILKQNLYL